MAVIRNRFYFLFIFLIIFSLSNFYGISLQKDDSPAALEQECKKYETDGNTIELSRCQTKLGFLYRSQNNYPKAIEFFQKAIKSNEVLGNQNGIKNLAVNIGLLYSESDNYEQAIVYFKKSLVINQKLGKQADIVSDLINIAFALQGMRNYAESNVNLDKAVTIAQEISDMVSLKNCYGMLSENYDKIGRNDKAKEYFELAASIKTHMQKEELKKFESRTKEAEAESYAKGEEIKNKEKTIEKISKEQELTNQLLQQEKELNDLKDKEFHAKEQMQKTRQKNILIGFGALLLILVVVLFSLFFIFKQLREKKKAYLLLEESNKQIIEQKKEIEIQRDIATVQKKKITDSIFYAQRIQNAVLPPLTLLDKILPEHFILFRPRDIVSGDFYWISAKEGVAIIAAVDCTGHGVPGAFMSMLGTAFLNDIVNKITFNRHILALHANEILNQLRENVITSLHQSGKANETKDGMDIALCIIDFEHKQMQYAGAHNPVYIIRNNEMKVIEADKMPIGIYKNPDQIFTNHEIPLEIGDKIYLFSDGYYDQFGGPNNSKLLSANFRKFLLEINERPMQDQKQLLSDFYDNWKGNREQVDDVMVIGFRFEPQIIITTVNRDYQWDSVHILIAEDIDVNFYLLVEALKNTKAQVHRVTNGAEAVEYCKRNEVDLVLMDIRMPVMDGIEASKQIRKILPDLPIIAQTAHGEEGDVELIQQAGCNDYISKPINLKLFLSVIKKHLKK